MKRGGLWGLLVTQAAGLASYGATPPGARQRQRQRQWQRPQPQPQPRCVLQVAPSTPSSSATWNPGSAAEELMEVNPDGSRRRLLATAEERLVEIQETGRKRRKVKSVLRRIFVPDHITPSYFAYSRWRCLQRLLSATVNVFGLQAMIMAVGVRDFQSGKAMGAAAAIDWVLKDALGKVARLAWAGRMGREFDGDAKRWRFRSSLLYASGNGLQIATFAFPKFFLALATVANCLKQISLLTSTATRSAIYRSFAVTETTNNIGDITAKGEAQIAVVDLAGMTLGILLSRTCGFDAVTRRNRLVGLYLGLSFLEICAMYQEIRCVVFRQLNLERAQAVVAAFVDNQDQDLPTPRFTASRERILLGSPRLKRHTFPRLSTLAIPDSQLADLLDVFHDDLFLLVPTPSAHLALVLHAAAKDTDVLKALLALNIAERRCDKHADLLDRLRHAKRDATTTIDDLLDAMRAAGWSTKSFMFPDIRVRADWPLSTDNRDLPPPR
ncbi:hypothetical protein CTAYLR_008219 [Chrysophaeum taylorii]|uniref:Protein root UVB sensitive/RUS domain-containing protein n=1 Tax=Chrysophaeum taylorii TaxID=2483200 RepID=A0AAD7XNX6_9STRA|nr:hypothetical protein CTAYLR_008219 [Chrysophaeum taylorii]